MLIFLYGTGPRQRSLTSALIVETGAAVREFDTLETALAAINDDQVPDVLLDARIAPDSAFFSELGNREAAIGTARGLGGGLESAPAAFVASARDDFVALVRGRNARRFIAGDWLVRTAGRAVANASPMTVRIHALSWEGVGYANGARELMLGLDAVGVRVDYRMDWRNGPADQLFEEDRAALMRMLETDADPASKTIVYHPPTHAGGAPILEVYREAFVRGPLISYTMFETDGLPARWRAPLAACEGVWVPSEFNRETFARDGIPAEKISVVPIGIDVDRYDIDGPRAIIPAARGFVFLAIGQWRLRKGWDILIAAYARAFEAKDPVTLVIRAGLEGIDVARDLQALCDRLGIGVLPHVVLLPNALSRDELQALYRSADAFVLPTRGEAFGIPYLEAMAMGVPTIGTGFGGSLDFLDPSTGYLIGSRMVEVDDAYARPLPFYRLQRWAEPSIEATAALMRGVYEHRDEAVLRAARGAVRVRTGFNRETIAHRALAALQRVPDRRRVATMRPKILIEAPLYSLGAAGREGRAFLAAAVRAKTGSACARTTGADHTVGISIEDLRTIKASLANELSGAIPVIAFEPSASRDAHRAILRATSQSTTATTAVVEACARYHEIWVPSAFAAGALERGGVPPAKIRIVTQGIDVDFWTPDGANPRAPNDGIFRFLAVLDWTLRDGWDVLLNAYVGAFRAGDPVSLTIQATDFVARADGRNVQAADEIRAFLSQRFADRASRNDIPPIGLNLGIATAPDLVKIFNAHDAFVAPGRIRSWGFVEAAAMACGLPTIAPRIGSQTAFMTEENSYLFDVSGLAAPSGESSTFANATWIEPNAEALGASMQRTVQRREESRLRGRRARADAVMRLSFEVLGRSLRDELARHSIDLPEPREPDCRLEPLLTVVVYSTGDPNQLERTLKRLRRNTTEVSLITLGDAQALAATQTPYVAIVRAGTIVGPGWDRVLLNALSTQPAVEIAMAHCVELPASGDPPIFDYDGAPIDRCDLEARDTAINARSTGTFTDHIDLRCALGTTEALQRCIGTVRLTETRAWTANDCRVFF